MSVRHLLSVDALDAAELRGLLDLADELKADRLAVDRGPVASRDDLAGCTVGLLLAEPSLRTRVAFEVGIAELGGTPVPLPGDLLDPGRGETIEDTARSLSGYLHAIVVRTGAQSSLEALAAAAGIPVINGRTDVDHPCQTLADLQTIREYKGELGGLKLAYVGDGGAVAHALLRGGALAGMHVAVASPAGYEPIPQVVGIAREIAAATGGRVTITNDPLEAARDADVVATAAWAAPATEQERDARRLMFRPYQVGYHVIEAARPDAIVLHPLPARRGEEIAADVIDGQQSVVWAQSANRLHTSKALLLQLLGGAEHRLGAPVAHRRGA